MVKDGIDATSRRGRVDAALRHRQPRGRPAHADDRRAGAVVALGRLDAHRVLDRDVHRRACRRRGQGSGRVPPRAARPSIRAIAGVLELAAEKAGWGKPLRPARPAKSAAAASRCTSRSAPTSRRWPKSPSTRTTTFKRRSRRVRGRLRHRRQPRRRSARRWKAASASGCRRRCYGAITLKDGVVEQIELPPLPGAAHQRDAGGRGPHRAVDREADRRRRARRAADRAGGRQRARRGDRQAPAHAAASSSPDPPARPSGGAATPRQPRFRRGSGPRLALTQASIACARTVRAAQQREGRRCRTVHLEDVGGQQNAQAIRRAGRGRRADRRRRRTPIRASRRPRSSSASRRRSPGPAMELGTEMRAGALAYFHAINARGGINGRKIELRTLDDGYEPDRAAANTKQLIDDGRGVPAVRLRRHADVRCLDADFHRRRGSASSARSPAPKRCATRSTATSSTCARATSTRPTRSSQQLTAHDARQDRHFLPERRLRQGRPRGRRARDEEAQPADRRAPAPSSATPSTSTAAVTSIAKVEPQAIIMISAYKSCAAFIKAMKQPAPIRNS